MKRFHFRMLTGPTAVAQVAARLRAVSMPWQRVTVEGTESVHFSIAALHAEAAQRESRQWFERAALPGFATCGSDIFKVTDDTL